MGNGGKDPLAVTLTCSPHRKIIRKKHSQGIKKKILKPGSSDPHCSLVGNENEVLMYVTFYFIS